MNQDLLKKSIDLYKEKANSLVADNDFKSLDPKLMEKNVFSLFSRFNAISMKFKDIMDFVSLLADAQDNKIRAFQSGSQKRIEDVKKNVIKNEDSIKEIQKEQESLKDKIWDLEAGQLDAKIEQDKMKSLEEKIQTLTLETASDQKTIQELSEGITGYSQALEESAVQKIYVQEAVYPVLNSLSFIQSFSMRQNNQPQDLETMIFIKTQK
jgi:predicted  nucleic acid-binding Zn-ribbon protein